MSIRSISALLAVATLVLASSRPVAAQDPAPAPKKAAPAPSKAKGAASGAKAQGKLKPVDINSASKNELAFMLKIPEEVAAKIVAGRPYPTKARLLTKNIVSAEVYAAIKDKVVARQVPEPGRR